MVVVPSSREAGRRNRRFFGLTGSSSAGEPGAGLDVPISQISNSSADDLFFFFFFSCSVGGTSSGPFPLVGSRTRSVVAAAGACVLAGACGRPASASFGAACRWTGRLALSSSGATCATVSFCWLLGRSSPGGGGQNIPSQYANAVARFFRLDVTSRTKALDVMVAQSRCRFSQQAMIRLPRTFMTAVGLLCKSIH
jgi:hypothetical protein